MKRYSSGMYVRLAFAVAAHLEPEILLVDEVLAVGDAQFQKKCLGKMEGIATGGRTILLVSHQMSLVRRLSRRAALLEKGRLTEFGPTEDVLQRYLSRGPAGCLPDDWMDLSGAHHRGSGGARFVAVRCRCPDEEAAGQPHSDGPLDVDLVIESETIRNVDGLAVRFHDHYGTLLVNANIQFTGESLALRRGRNEVTLHIEQLHLNPGPYTVELRMGIARLGEVIDEISPAFRLDVTDAPGIGGLAAGPPNPRVRGLVSCRYRFEKP